MDFTAAEHLLKDSSLQHKVKNSFFMVILRAAEFKRIWRTHFIWMQ